MSTRARTNPPTPRPPVTPRPDARELTRPLRWTEVASLAITVALVALASLLAYGVIVPALVGRA